MKGLKAQILEHQKNMLPWLDKRQKAYESVQDFTVDSIEAQRVEKRIKYYNRKIKKEQIEIDRLTDLFHEENSNQLTIE